MPIPSGAGGEIFCRLVQNNFFVWFLAKVSVSIVMTMAIERWYAIARPHQYRETFKRKSVLKHVALIFVFNFVVISPQLFKIHLETKGNSMRCIYNSLGGNKMASQIYVISYCMATVFIPFAVISATYIHLRCVVTGRRHPPHTLAQIQRKRMEMTLLRMTAAVALCLAICFTPNQITYILLSFGIVHLVVIRVAAVLSMLNSVINPWVYCLTNKSYREEFVALLFPKRKRNVLPKYLETTTSGCHEMAYLQSQEHAFRNTDSFQLRNGLDCNTLQTTRYNTTRHDTTRSKQNKANHKAKHDAT